MDLHKLFALLETLGHTTLGQVKSALVSVGIHPESIAINHAELDKALQGLKPVAVAAAGTAAAAAAGALSPAAAPAAQAIASQAAALAVEAAIPHLEHLVEAVEIRLRDHLSELLAPVHAALTAAAPPTSSTT